MNLRERIALLSAISGGFLLGCLVAEWMPWWGIWPIFLAGLLASLVLVWPHRIVRTVLIVFVSFVAAILYWQNEYRSWNVKMPVGEDVTVRGFLATPLSHRERNERAVLAIEEIKIHDSRFHSPRPLRVAIYVESGSDLEYGDQIEFRGKLQRLPRFGSFDGQRYWRVRGVQAVAYPKDVRVLGEGRANPVARSIYTLKDHIKSRVENSLKGTEGQLLLGLLFGDQAATMPKELSDQFRNLGISHLTAVSGYNLTIISLWPLLLAGFNPKRWAIILSALFVLIFVIFTGAPSSIVRAAIMAWVVLIGKSIGRAPHSLLLILLTAAVMAVVNPFVVKDDAGFALSFLAFFGLVEVGPLIALKLKFIKWEGLRNLISETSGAQLTTLPYLLGIFGQFSFAAPLTNVLVLPFIPLVMIVGLILVVLALIPIKLFSVLLSMLYFPLHGFLYLVSASRQLTHASIPWPRGGYFPWYVIALILGWWGISVLRKHRVSSTIDGNNQKKV